MAKKGRVTVGITVTSANHLDALKETGWFEEDIDVYLLAISTALSRELVVSQIPLTGTKTKFNVGSLDRDGRLRDLVRLMGPKDLEDPYEYAERLADVGLEFLKRKMVDEGSTLSEALGLHLTQPSTEESSGEEIA